MSNYLNKAAECVNSELLGDDRKQVIGQGTILAVIKNVGKLSKQ